MKKIFTILVFTFSTMAIFAQTDCSELFISEYVEGGNNNKAIELYNPTSAAIDLSGYSVGRFANGETSFTGIQIPSAMIQPYGTYVIVLDKQNPQGTGNEYPVWDGYQEWDVCLDFLTGEPIINMAGDTVYCVQVDTMNNNEPIYGTVYRDFLDLQGKADVFLCPVYGVNNAMYFNGDDAVGLISGTEVLADGSNIIDIVGVIGEDPGQAWVDANGSWVTRDKTLERNSDIKYGTGFVLTGQDTFAYEHYEIWWKNYFSGLGSHDCECDPDFMSSTQDLNQVAFQMFPNPTSSELFLRAEENIERVEIYNLLGERVFFQTYENTLEVNLSVGKYDTGMYMVSLFFENEHQSIQKFIKK